MKGLIRDVRRYVHRGALLSVLAIWGTAVTSGLLAPTRLGSAIAASAIIIVSLSYLASMLRAFGGLRWLQERFAASKEHAIGIMFFIGLLAALALWEFYYAPFQLYTRPERPLSIEELADGVSLAGMTGSLLIVVLLLVARETPPPVLLEESADPQ